MAVRSLHDTFYPLSLEGKKFHEACECMGGTPIPTVTSPPSIASKRGVKNDSGVERGSGQVARSPPPFRSFRGMKIVYAPR